MKRAVVVISLMVLGQVSGCSRSGATAEGTKDWPQFRGPNSNGISSETGIARNWPETGPEELWRIPIGVAYSGIAVSGGELYTMDSDDQEEFLVRFDATDGREVWRKSVGPLFKNSYGDGPRSTPTVEDEVVYALGAEGRLVAVNRKDGSPLWNIELKETFSFREPKYWWGFSGSPLIGGDMLLLNVGGDGDKSIAAVDKQTGDVIWTAHSDVAAYSTPTVVEFNGQMQFVFVTGQHVVSLSPDGDTLWKYPWEGSIIKIAMPIFIPPDKVFVSASYGIGAVLLQMKPEGDGVGIEELWSSKVMSNHFHTSILLDQHLYGFDNGTLKCIEVESGEQTWAKRRLGKGSLIYADGLFIVLSEKGKLVLVEARHEAYIETASAQVLEGRTWTQPTLADGKLYLRHQSEMVCLDLTKHDS